MIRVILLTFLFLLGSSVMAQEEYLTLKCVDIFYTKTHNLGFVNKVISQVQHRTAIPSAGVA